MNRDTRKKKNRHRIKQKGGTVNRRRHRTVKKNSHTKLKDTKDTRKQWNRYKGGMMNNKRQREVDMPPQSMRFTPPRSPHNKRTRRAPGRRHH